MTTETKYLLCMACLQHIDPDKYDEHRRTNH
jgi:hypothetical protein